MTVEDYKKIADLLPRQPGVYRFKDEEDTVLYVGKAKNLKNRLSSYFVSSKQQAHKTRVMVKNAKNIEYTIVETEQDALLLENTLIKQLRPRYNVMLKDDKSYSYICIKNEAFPRVYLTRRVIRDGSTYFGPYTSKFRIKIILNLIKSLFPLRNCALSLTPDNIASGKFSVCLEYHIKNCQGPCIGKENDADYNQKISQIKNMLKGNFGAVISHFRQQMLDYAENLEFEKAQEIKEKLSAFEDYQSKSTVVSSNIRDVDVFSIAADEKKAYVNYLKVVNGALMNTYTLEMTKNLNDDEKELLSYAISELRERFNSIAEEIILPFHTELADAELKITLPQRGEKRKLLELSEKNVQFFLKQKQKEEILKKNKQTSTERILRTLQQDLQLPSVPTHLECFDNSNIQGSFPVASCVVFKNARPAKKDYRHYHIKTVEGPNDFASMEEVVYRRYKRLLDENQPLPQLIVIDGGKGQLNAAVKSLTKLDLLGKVTVIGIAKKLEEIFFPGDPLPLYLNKKSESLKLIQQARNEAHRFAITFHRNQRSRNFTQTTLTNIPGIGEKTAEKLLQAFKSVKKIKEASTRELENVAGKAATLKLQAFFKVENETKKEEE